MQSRPSLEGRPAFSLPRDYGKTRILAAPVAVATCSAGGSTIVSSSIRLTCVSGSPAAVPRVFDVFVAGSHSVTPPPAEPMAMRPSGKATMSVTLPPTPSDEGLKYVKQLAIGPIPRHGAPVSSNTAIPYLGLDHHTLPSGATVTPLMKTSSPSIGGWEIGGEPLPRGGGVEEGGPPPPRRAPRQHPLRAVPLIVDARRAAPGIAETVREGVVTGPLVPAGPAVGLGFAVGAPLSGEPRVDDLARAPLAARPEIAIGPDGEPPPVAHHLRICVRARLAAVLVLADARVQVIGEPDLVVDVHPAPLRHVLEPLVRRDLVDAVLRPDVELVLVDEVVEGHALDVAAVPELGGVAAHQIEADHLDGSVVLQPDAVDLAGMPVWIAGGSIVRIDVHEIMEAVIADEDLVRAASDDLGDARIRRCPEDVFDNPAGKPGVCVLDRVVLQMQVGIRRVAVGRLQMLPFASVEPELEGRVARPRSRGRSHH